MLHVRVDVTAALDGSPVVQAVFDLSEAEVAGAAHAVNASRTEQFRGEELSADAVLAMRELTALADQLTALAAYARACTLAISPARLVALRDTLDAFALAREEAGFIREEDRPAYGIAVSLAGPLAELSEQTLRAALAASAPAGC